MNILHITSSLRGAESESNRVAASIVSRLTAANPDAAVVSRDLARNPHPQLDEAALGALFTPAEQRSPEQAARVALDDALIAQVQAADVVVIGAPMYNFGIPVQLKSWFDAIARAGVTFRYTESGPEGLLKGKQVFVATSRGGIYPADADPQVPFVRMLLNFLGMTDHTFVYSAGQAMGPDAAAKGRAEADAAIEAALA
ncbi:FMN-dependent NADH-azoreductase [Massilia sp. Dwa41.01b]|uniref:FMN-dependent NADH-azoreductase n=1 Tax=unclassified Massilia TaxID=2609279 RepID=UPI0015FFC324|nr:MULTISPECIES: NAD(P)H-dependent oxidoreductase [unclassified Massilia]QNA88828.1 FMN-dependent NADH-azoreductase [Massilia sp. Dwa41.01b]QNA99724.1 FMN-dependent NADH-azoreductase [Massilia sp. Se16.2.3]